MRIDFNLMIIAALTAVSFCFLGIAYQAMQFSGGRFLLNFNHFSEGWIEVIFLAFITISGFYLAAERIQEIKRTTKKGGD